MAGKRPDQYQIAPDEAGSTDYKRYPQTGRGNSDALDTTEGDKQRLAQAQQEGEAQPFLPDVPSPSAEAQRAAKREQGQLKDQKTGTEDPGA
jgi:hypothetical protein